MEGDNDKNDEERCNSKRKREKFGRRLFKRKKRNSGSKKNRE